VRSSTGRQISSWVRQSHVRLSGNWADRAKYIGPTAQPGRRVRGAPCPPVIVWRAGATVAGPAGPGRAPRRQASVDAEAGALLNVPSSEGT